jgi:hypothetical protein
MEPRHFHLQSHQIHPVLVVVRRRARTKAEAIYNPTEAELKDLLEPKRKKAVENLQSYQNKTRAWRD